MPQARACIGSGRMPTSIAAVRSSATASNRLPSAVRVSSRCSPRVISSAASPAAMRPGSIRSPPRLCTSPSRVSGSATKFAEKAQSAP